MSRTRAIGEMLPRDRPRERLRRDGAGALRDEELLAIILGSGTQGNSVSAIAKKLVTVLDEHFSELGKHKNDLDIREILKIKGIGQAKALAIAAALEFVRRRVRPKEIKIQKASDILPLIQHYAYEQKQERLVCVSLNGANEVISINVVTVGLVNRTQVHPREVFANAITERAAAIIVAHNHPSGNTTPSPDDITVTQRLKKAADILGIHLLDHIIFTAKDNYYSFSEHQKL